MAKEIECVYLTGSTVYAVLINSIGQVYNTAGAAFEAYNASNIADYDIALTEQGASGLYMGDMPSVAADVYNVSIRLRAGGTPAQGDLNIGSGSIMWDGTLIANLASWADALLKRNWASVSGEAARSVLNALRKLRNEWSISGTTLTVKKEDDATTAYTQSLTATPGADPITAIDN